MTDASTRIHVAVSQLEQVVCQLKGGATEIALLQSKLENSELRAQVQELRGVVEQYQRELKESNALLLKQRLPPRPYTNSTEKQLIAASQQWKCAGEELSTKEDQPGLL